MWIFKNKYMIQAFESSFCIKGDHAFQANLKSKSSPYLHGRQLDGRDAGRVHHGLWPVGGVC